MADNNNFKLKEKTCDMLDYMRDRLKNFPREERSGITYVNDTVKAIVEFVC